VKEWTTGNLAQQRGRLVRQEGRKSKFKKEIGQQAEGVVA